jgi:hypothetical protein
MPKVKGRSFSELIETEIYIGNLGRFVATLTHGVVSVNGKAYMPVVKGSGRTRTGEFWSERSEAEAEAEVLLKKANEEFEQDLLRWKAEEEAMKSAYEQENKKDGNS